MGKLILTVKVINEKREGISQRTGNAWKRQDIICEWPDGDRLNMQKFTLFSDNVDTFESLGVAVGDQITADPFWGTEFYGGKVYNLNTLFNICKG